MWKRWTAFSLLPSLLVLKLLKTQNLNLKFIQPQIVIIRALKWLREQSYDLKPDLDMAEIAVAFESKVTVIEK